MNQKNALYNKKREALETKPPETLNMIYYHYYLASKIITPNEYFCHGSDNMSETFSRISLTRETYNHCVS